jgi:PRTRC genetic system protein E
METNFFRIVSQMDINGEIHLIISKGENNSLVVATMVQNDKCTDSAKDFITPLTLRGTAEQMDKGYFLRIRQPLRDASELMDNMEAFKKQMDEAKRKSAMARESADREKKANDAKEKKYAEGMQKAEELEREGKFREAWMKVPDPSEYPERADLLRTRREQLSARFAPDLFAPPAPPQDNRQEDKAYDNIAQLETFATTEEIGDDGEIEY